MDVIWAYEHSHYRKYMKPGSSGLGGAPSPTSDAKAPITLPPTLPSSDAPYRIQELEFSDDEDFPEKLQGVMRDDGVVIVNGVLSEFEINKGIDLFWNTITTMCPLVRRDSVASWRNQNWPRNYSSGIIQEGNIAGSEYMWFARTRPNVVRLFEILLGKTDLIVSLDTTRATRGQNTAHSVPLHVDKHLRGAFNRFTAYQAGINFTDSGPFQSGFCAVRGSHKKFEQLFHSPGITEQKGNCVVLPDDHPMQKQAVKPSVKAGSVVLWDMCTVHGVTSSPEKTKTPTSKCLTLTAFASYFPRRDQIRRDMPARRIAAACGASNTHWAIACVGGNIIRWPRASGSRPLISIPSFLPEHEAQLGKWI